MLRMVRKQRSKQSLYSRAWSFTEATAVKRRQKCLLTACVQRKMRNKWCSDRLWKGTDSARVVGRGLNEAFPSAPYLRGGHLKAAVKEQHCRQRRQRADSARSDGSCRAPGSCKATVMARPRWAARRGTDGGWGGCPGPRPAGRAQLAQDSRLQFRTWDAKDGSEQTNGVVRWVFLKALSKHNRHCRGETPKQGQQTGHNVVQAKLGGRQRDACGEDGRTHESETCSPTEASRAFFSAWMGLNYFNISFQTTCLEEL